MRKFGAGPEVRRALQVGQVRISKSWSSPCWNPIKCWSDPETTSLSDSLRVHYYFHVGKLTKLSTIMIHRDNYLCRWRYWRKKSFTVSYKTAICRWLEKKEGGKFVVTSLFVNHLFDDSCYKKLEEFVTFRCDLDTKTGEMFYWAYVIWIASKIYSGLMISFLYEKCLFYQKRRYYSEKLMTNV